MAKASRLNKQAVPIFLRTWAWLLLMSLFPAALYAYTESPWTGIKVFLVFGTISGAGLLWGFWSVLFPKPPAGE